jgi:dienelactone hydrolase
MGAMILNIAVFIEWAFATYCLVTKSNQRSMRSILSISALIIFFFLTLVSVVPWNFRWYGLALLLFIWAALGVWALICKKAVTDVYEPKPIIRGAVRTMLLLVVVMIPALIFPQTKLPPMTGSHPVVTISYTFTDKSRIETFTNTGENREVNVEFWYPKDGGGPYPLVVFSHGTSALKLSNYSTFMDLASNGYVVCSIDHPYHSLFTVDTNGHRAIVDRSYLQQYLDFANGKYDAATNYELEHEWMSLRIADIKFVLDTILANAKDPSSDAVYRLIDPTKIGLMGHSLGGESSAQVARERNDIGAVVNLDADLAGEYVDFVNGKKVLNEVVYPVPILNILTDALAIPIAAVPNAKDVIAVEHVTATAPNAYQVHLAGTNHFSVTDMPLISPTLVWMINASVPSAGGQEVDPYGTIEKMNATVLEFFNAYLKGEGNFTTAGMN